MQTTQMTPKSISELMEQARRDGQQRIQEIELMLDFLRPLPIIEFLKTGNIDLIQEIRNQVAYRGKVLEEILVQNDVDLSLDDIDVLSYVNLRRCLKEIKTLRVDVGTLRCSAGLAHQKLIDIKTEIEQVLEAIDLYLESVKTHLSVFSRTQCYTR